MVLILQPCLPSSVEEFPTDRRELLPPPREPQLKVIKAQPLLASGPADTVLFAMHLP